MIKDLQGSRLMAILRQLCPRCRTGRIFPRSILFGLPPMHDRCPVCGLQFEREPGYFLGAMYISYFLSIFTLAALGLGLWAFTGASFEQILLWSFLLFLPLVVPLTLFSRVVWIHLDQAVDPDTRLE